MARVLCVLITVLLFTLTGCSEEPGTAPSTAPAAQTAVPQKTPPPSTTEVAEEVAEEETFKYLAAGRRDPFMPLTVVRKPVGRTDVPLTPLQRFEVSQYTIMGVILGLSEPRAMVAAPDGKSYILKRGMKIGKNDGVIIDIDNEFIRIEEKFYDFSGNVRTNIQEIEVPKREGV